MIRYAWCFALTLSVLSCSLAEAVDVPAPYISLSPTIGALRWDDQTVPSGTLDSKYSPMAALRVGYAPVTAFAGELVLLTSSNDVTFGSGANTTQGSVRLVQAELSFLVNFQSLVNARIYPFLDLGIGGVFRTVTGSSSGDNNSLAFHIGGGLRYEISPKVGLRAGVRDTFFNETRRSGDIENQVTVDSVEISLILDYRIPLSSGEGGGKRLR